MDKPKFVPIDHTIKFKTNNLFQFETVVDIDLSIIMFVMNNLANESFIDPIVNKIDSISGFKNILLYRKETNPLSAIIKEKYKNSYDSILNEIMTTYGKEIYKTSHPTDIFDLIRITIEKDGMINNVVQCKNDFEVQKIHDLESNCTTIKDEYDLKNYDTLYIKYICDIIKFKNVDNKTLFFINGRYNMQENDIPKMEAILFSQYNNIAIIDPYKDLSIPKLGGHLTNEQRKKFKNSSNK